MTLFCKNGRSDSLTLAGRLAGGECVAVTVVDGVIARIEPAAATRRVLAPAFVDPHVHLRSPGREDEETIASGSAAAAAGGYCAILAMPNTDPGRRLGRRARLSGRGGTPGRGRPDRVHGGHLEAARRRRADGDGGACRRRGGGVHRRRPARHVRRADAPRAPVRRGHRPQARPPLRGADTLTRRPGARRLRLAQSSASPRTRRSRRARWSSATCPSRATSTSRST